MGDYKYKMVKAKGLDGDVELIGPSYEGGGLNSGATYNWKRNLADREKYIKYVTESERYWYMPADKWFGSERRKNPA